MSNKTQLQTNNSALDGYIARINAAKDVATGLPEAGSSGGGSIETCTVNLVNYALDAVDFYYTLYTNGSMLGSIGCVYDEDSETKNNVPKGTYIIIFTDELVSASGSNDAISYASNVKYVYLSDDTVTITIG